MHSRVVLTFTTTLFKHGTKVVVMFCLFGIFLGEEHNFLQLSSTEINSLNEPYDYGSIMHYGKSTFAKEVSQVTILPKRDPETELIPEIGQRDQLSKGDIRQTSKMYRCAGKVKKNLYLFHAERNAIRCITVLSQIGHFRFILCLCFKTSASANLSYENEFCMQFHFHANQTLFS